jgi:hypothetical protein
MKAYVYATGAVIPPFNDPVGQMPVLNVPLDDYRRQELSCLVDAVVPVQDPAEIPPEKCLILGDDCFVTRFFLRRLLRQHERTGAGGQAGVPEGPYTAEKGGLDSFSWRSLPGDGRAAAFPLWLWSGGAVSREALAEAPLLLVEQQVRVFVPDAFRVAEEEDLKLVVTREGILALRHWSRLPDINQLAFTAWWADFRPRNLAWFLWKGLSALSLNKWKILGRVNKIGRGCDLHPTATVELSVLGDGVTLAPYAHVVGSFVGAGSRVESHAHVMGSVLGERSFVSYKSSVVSEVTFPEALASPPGAHCGVLGRKSRAMTGSYIYDTKLDPRGLQEIKVLHRGQLVSSGRRFLGMALGHGSILGAGTYFQSGLEVPNNVVIVRDREQVISKAGHAQGGQVYSLQDGELLPYGQRYRERHAAKETPTTED